MASRYFIKFNFNPWKQAAVDDCAIRAVSGATGLSYKEVCKRYGMAYRNGYGLIRKTGIDLEDIKQKFDEYFDIVQDFSEDMDFVPDEMRDTFDAKLAKALDQATGSEYASGITLEDFCDMYDGQGDFLVGLSPNPEAKDEAAKTGGHIVLAKLSNASKRKGFVDTWDSSEMLVDSFMRIAKKEPKNSPLHWKYDYVNHRFIV